MFAVKFAGVTIEGIERIEQTRETKLAKLDFPRRHGALNQDVGFSAPLTITLSGEVSKDSEADLIAYFDALATALFQAGVDRLFLRDGTRFLNCICSATSFPGFSAGRRAVDTARFSIEFFAADPFWYDEGEEADAGDTIAASPHVFTLTNSGKVRTPPRFQFKASDPISSLKLTNTTTGLFLRYNGALASGDLLVIDSSRYSVDKNGLNDLNNFEGSFWWMEAGANNLLYEGTIGIEITIAWRKAYLIG